MFQPVIELESISSHLLKWKPRLLIGGRGANPVISESLSSHRCPTYHRVSVTSGARMLGSKLLLSLYNPLDKPGASCGDSLVTLTLEMTQ